MRSQLVDSRMVVAVSKSSVAVMDWKEANVSRWEALKESNRSAMTLQQIAVRCRYPVA